MQAGLLICDHVAPEYQAEFGDYPDMFVRLFPELDWTFFDVCNGQFPDGNPCEVYMITGSRHSVYEDVDWILKTKDMLRRLVAADAWIVGVCFGHQLLGDALGGRVARSPNGWRVGVHEFQIDPPQQWMQPFQNPLNLLMMCQDQVLDLPAGAVRLAGNVTCPNGMVLFSPKVLGIQAHPEFPKDYDRLLMEKRVARMGESVVAAGLQSLEKPVHRDDAAILFGLLKDLCLSRAQAEINTMDAEKKILKAWNVLIVLVAVYFEQVGDLDTVMKSAATVEKTN